MRVLTGLILALAAFSLVLLRSGTQAQGQEGVAPGQSKATEGRERTDLEPEARCIESAPVPGDGKAILEWKFRKGDVLRYKLTQSNFISGDDRFIESEQNEVTLVLRLEVADVDARGVGTVETTFERVVYRVFEGGRFAHGPMETRYDSETDTVPPESGRIAALKGKSIVTKVSPRGEILSLEIDDEAVRSCVSDEQLESMMQHNFGLLPSKPVSEDDTWEGLSRYRDTLLGTSSKMHLDNFRLGMKNRYQLRGPDKRGVATVWLGSDFEIRIRDLNREDKYVVESANAGSHVAWLADRGIVGSVTSTTNISVSYALVHTSRLTTTTTFKLMAEELAAPRMDTVGAGGQEKPDPVESPGPAAFEERTCVRVIDGDTIELDGGERVRYIGIDTPETKHPRKPVEWMGKEATEANRVLVEGRKVHLEYDVERKDKYGRTLAYVWAGDVMVNERLVQLGYAQVSTYPPNVRHEERFLGAQREAREAQRGLWGERPEAEAAATVQAPPAAAGAEIVYITRTGQKYHRDGCQYLRQSRIPIALKDAIARGYGACSRCGP